AYLRPVCRRYLGRLAPLAERVLVMTSAAGLMPLAEAAERPAALLLSGPAGGVLAAVAAAVAAGFPDAVTFDMGGTSTDVCLVRGRIPADAALPGLGRLEVEAARSALAAASVDAAGVVDVVDAAMVGAVRAVSVERGVDPRRLALVAFGGAGPLHACALASAL